MLSPTVFLSFLKYFHSASNLNHCRTDSKCIEVAVSCSSIAMHAASQLKTATPVCSDLEFYLCLNLVFLLHSNFPYVFACAYLGHHECRVLSLALWHSLIGLDLIQLRMVPVSLGHGWVVPRHSIRTSTAYKDSWSYTMPNHLYIIFI